MIGDGPMEKMDCDHPHTKFVERKRGKPTNEFPCGYKDCHEHGRFVPAKEYDVKDCLVCQARVEVEVRRPIQSVVQSTPDRR